MGEEERNCMRESERRKERPCFKIKSETKNFLTLANVNRATSAGSTAEVSKLLCAGMLLLVGSRRSIG